MKKWYKSDTILLAILQGIAGVIAALMVNDPTLQSVGYLAIIKSIVDIGIRMKTEKTIQ